MKIRLVLEKIIEAEKITVEDKEVEEQIEKMVASAKEAGRELDEHDINQRRPYVKSDLLMAKVVEFLKANNKFVAGKEEEKPEEKKPETKKASSAKKSAPKKAATKTDKKDE